MTNQTEDLNPKILQFFQYEHLPPHLKRISEQFSSLAYSLLKCTLPSAEQSAGLRKLLEAQDCFVRAAVQPSDHAGTDENRYMLVDSGGEAMFYIPVSKLEEWQKGAGSMQWRDWDELPEWVGIVDVNDYDDFTFTKPRVD